MFPGLSYLFLLVLYLALLVPAFTFLVMIFVVKKKKLKLVFLSLFLFCLGIFIMIPISKNNSHRKDELHEVGVYYLTDYPNCDSCKIQLKEDNTFIVFNDTTVVETGDWHFESGPDFFITYLHGGRYQLGCGKYAYKKYKLKYYKKSPDTY